MKTKIHKIKMYAFFLYFIFTGIVSNASIVITVKADECRDGYDKVTQTSSWLVNSAGDSSTSFSCEGLGKSFCGVNKVTTPDIYNNILTQLGITAELLDSFLNFYIDQVNNGSNTGQISNGIHSMSFCKQNQSYQLTFN